MPEEVLFESESGQTRAEIATYLRTVADKLEDGDPLTLTTGARSQTLDPPDRVTFEVKAEREGPVSGPGELSIEFELEWDENGTGSEDFDGPLEIQ
ncbi:amphi-Trp domain-containing protein [Halodesulfurarchaeum sp.]|uniref:amphi-Trp domain-containing protein n=1 Tax=Halodesulfurarchaeum sp. TaxID=1980530 RepID=UPI002FC2EB13